MNDNKPSPWLISVIIPIYNVSAYLVEALESVIHQTYRNLEIILVDDGSTDNSNKICESYADIDSRITVVHQINQGLSAARNAGLDIMHGDAVAFLDADDAFCPDMLETMLNEMISENADLVVCQYAVFRTNNIMSLQNSRYNKSSLLVGIFNQREALNSAADGTLNGSVWNKLFRTEIWDKTRFPVGRVYEDTIVIWRLFNRAHKISVIPNLLYLHRKHLGSITATNSPQNRHDWLTSQKELEDFVQQKTPDVFSAKQFRIIRQRRITGLLSFYLLLNKKVMNKDRQKFRKDILTICYTFPINECALYVRCAWQLFCFCPIALDLLYPFYKFLRHSMRKVSTCIKTTNNVQIFK